MTHAEMRALMLSTAQEAVRLTGLRLSDASIIFGQCGDQAEPPYYAEINAAYPEQTTLPAANRQISEAMKVLRANGWDVSDPPQPDPDNPDAVVGSGASKYHLFLALTPWITSYSQPSLPMFTIRGGCVVTDSIQTAVNGQDVDDSDVTALLRTP